MNDGTRTTLHCRNCGKSVRTRRTHFNGRPITEWWRERGKLCSHCYGAAFFQQLDEFNAEKEAESPLERKFREFHRDNPQVYNRLREEGLALLSRGHKRFGIALLYERLRWMTLVSTWSDEYDLKLPNNFRAYYARKLMEENPEFEDVFHTAELRSRRKGQEAKG